MKTLIHDFSMSLEEFYNNLPVLQGHYYAKIEKENQDYCTSSNIDFNQSKTKYIIAFAYRFCIDSIVNLNALKCFDKNSNIVVKVIINEDIIKNKFTNIATPILVGLDENYSVLWQWNRTPKFIENIENNSPQQEVIVKKMLYRKGVYIKNTFEELVDLISKN
ncbi:thioredoxin family protein [Helicovermis profundi]|uniref:Uncharacterized protein n=1 Tax=Helicovermis profundi TaxID=3065157 RepID=A0AAU9E9V1_9FIRM|nr:hypothetical protein HLPR_03700 [Clostridia bacterium S502]